MFLNYHFHELQNYYIYVENVLKTISVYVGKSNNISIVEILSRTRKRN